MKPVLVIGKAPSFLGPEEAVIKPLDFIEEIEACDKRRGGTPILGVNYLRAIADEVGRKYDKKFNAYRHVVPSDYIGRVCNTVQEVAETVREMFLARYPQIFDAYASYKWSTVSYGARVVYFTGSEAEAESFVRTGAELADTEDVTKILTYSVQHQENNYESQLAQTFPGETPTQNSQGTPPEHSGAFTDIELDSSALEDLVASSEAVPVASEGVVEIVEEKSAKDIQDSKWKNRNRNKSKFSTLSGSLNRV